MSFALGNLSTARVVAVFLAVSEEKIHNKNVVKWKTEMTSGGKIILRRCPLFSFSGEPLSVWSDLRDRHCLMSGCQTVWRQTES